MARGLKILSALMALTLGATIIAGCSEAPGTVVDDGKKMRGIQLQQGSGQQQPNSQAVIQQIMAGVSQMRTQVNNIRCDLTGYFVSEKDGSTGSNKCNFAFEKPNKTSIQMLESTDSRTVGTKLVWTGGHDLAVKTKFIGFWVKTTIDYHDSRATDQRGYFIDETGINPLLDTLLDQRNQVKLLGIGQMNGVPVAQLDVTSPRSLRGISHEVFTIDGQKMIPVAREMYDKSNKLVFRIRMDNVTLNSTLPSTTFQLD